MRVRKIDQDFLELETENISPIRYLFVPLADPGDVQTLYFLNRQTNGEWGYYSLARIAANASSLVEGHAASYINRAVAFFRYVGGIATDLEPPAAR